MKLLKYLIFVFVFACIVTNITGCDNDGEVDINEKQPVVSIILSGKHANSKHFDVQLETTVKQVYSSFGNIGIITIDGNPTLIRDDTSTGILGCYNADYIKESKKAYKKNNRFWQREYIGSQTKKVIDELNKCNADDPEVDIVQALCTAVDSLNTIENSMETSVKKQIVVLDTGLCTSGIMNFLDQEYFELLNYEGKLWEDNTMNTKVSERIDYLESQAEIPNLKGISVTWYGLGQVSEPQPNLSKLGIQNLQYIWGEFLSKAGASPSDKENADERYSIFVPTSSYGAVKSDQYVTPILWKHKEGEPRTKSEFPEQKVNFIRNSDKYLSSEEKKKVEDYYTSVLQGCSDEKVLLVGTTSSWDDGPLDSKDLSERRAERVKNTMIQLGVLDDCISTIGVSYNTAFCQDDSPNGRFEESIAKENRSVLILSYDSPKAQKILSDK